MNKGKFFQSLVGKACTKTLAMLMFPFIFIFLLINALCNKNIKSEKTKTQEQRYLKIMFVKECNSIDLALSNKADIFVSCHHSSGEVSYGVYVNRPELLGDLTRSTLLRLRRELNALSIEVNDISIIRKGHIVLYSLVA